MRLYIDYDGIFCDQCTSIMAAYPDQEYNTYQSQLYTKFDAEFLQSYKDRYNWYVRQCGIIPGSIESLMTIINSGEFSSIHILTAKLDRDIPLLLMHMSKAGILNDDTTLYPNKMITKHGLMLRTGTCSKFYDLYNDANYKNPTVNYPSFEITRENYPELFKLPIDSIICVASSDDKPYYISERPGVLIDDRMPTILKLCEMNTPFTYGVWIEHVWSKDKLDWSCTNLESLLRCRNLDRLLEGGESLREIHKNGIIKQLIKKRFTEISGIHLH